MTSKTKLLRLQKFMAQCGVASRRKCEELIAGGKVAVNGKVQTKLGTSIDPRRDRVSVSGKPVRPVERGVLLLHKPIKVVSTMHDPEGRPTVAHYLSKHYRSYFPVGRLDFDSSGLVVMTNDGDLAERMLHPRYGSERVYIVEAQGSVPRRILETLSQGVKLEDGVVQVQARILENLGQATLLQVSIREGRNRVVRRVMDKLGFPVLTLHRISHGPFRLGKLKPGTIKKLSEREYRSIRARVLARDLTN